MTCRHSSNDPDCTRGGTRDTYSSSSYQASYPSVDTPDASNYEVIDVSEDSGYMILKVKYPNCSRCAFEGTKVMVFENVTVLQAFKWKKIDPHFRNTKKNYSNEREAPSPIARFPGNDIGWTNARAFVRMLVNAKNNVGVR